jgi:hypothetical protein
MKAKMFALSALLLVSRAQAADFGVGLSAKSDDAWVYAPIDIANRFRIEPALRYAQIKTHSEYVNDRPAYVSSDSGGNSSHFDQLEFSIGLFGLSSVADSVRIYYGARVAYIEGSNKQTRTSVYDSDFGPTFSTVTTTHDDFDGYRVGPSLGFEYLFGKHFSLGGEVEWTYQKTDGDSKISGVDNDGTPVPGSRSNYSQTTNGTGSRLVARYRF